jgi:hypothetical protein
LQWLRAVQGTSWGNLTFTATNVYNDANVAWAGSTKPY